MNRPLFEPGSMNHIRQVLVTQIPWSDHPVWKGIDCGDGWLDLISRLNMDLKIIHPTYQVAQIKEKFGGLRYYLDETNDALEARIRQAEDESFRTCEMCGKPGTLRDSERWWIRTLCDKHEEERKARKA